MPSAKPKYIPIKSAARHFPTQPTADTIRDWCNHGIQDPNGQEGTKIRLQCHRVGVRILTTKVWIDDFIAKCQKH